MGLSSPDLTLTSLPPSSFYQSLLLLMVTLHEQIVPMVSLDHSRSNLIKSSSKLFPKSKGLLKELLPLFLSRITDYCQKRLILIKLWIGFQSSFLSLKAFFLFTYQFTSKLDFGCCILVLSLLTFMLTNRGDLTVARKCHCSTLYFFLNTFCL